MIEKLVEDATEGNFPASPQNAEKLRCNMQEHYYQKYGPWYFNEIIGYLRLHFLGSQVRGEYFGSKKKKLYLRVFCGCRP